LAGLLCHFAFWPYLAVVVSLFGLGRGVLNGGGVRRRYGGLGIPGHPNPIDGTAFWPRLKLDTGFVVRSVKRENPSPHATKKSNIQSDNSLLENNKSDIK